MSDVLTLEVSQQAMTQAHAVLAGGGAELAAVIDQTRAAGGPVEWRAVLTPQTVHYLGAFCALAAQEGAKISLSAQGLNERELAFVEDFRLHGPAAARSGGRGDVVKTLAVAAGEAAYAAWQMRPRNAGPKRDPRGGKAVIIGAYGGDHVGDTAILGGVLLHLCQTFGINKAEVLSHRPEHTARLAKGLSVPLEVRVHPYNPATIGERMKDAALLVVAGGPMMDLPRVLAKHLAAVNLARSLGVGFHIERVGVGPFKRKISRWAARRLFEAADSISLRTSGAGQDPTLEGLAYSVGRDPAFDYLATRTTLDRTTGAIDSAAEMLAGTKERVLIGLNLRPIRHEWAKKGAAFSRDAEARFLNELADGMVRVAQESAKPVTYVFFPMNPIEFGMSDLAAAWRLHKLVGSRVDLRVWEADPDIEDVLWLLRRLDGVLAMRFHAAIFSLSQGVPTFGADYYPGQGGKVEQLFADFGRPDDAARLDTFTADWLAGKLKSVTAAKKKLERA